MDRRRRRRVTSAEQTIAFGRELALSLPKDATLCFFGDLGAGKTTLIKGIVETLSSIPIDEVTSPTFTYLNSYGLVHHFDLYRMENEEQFLKMGFDEFLGEGICCIEWSEKIPSLIPKEAYRVKISYEGETNRLIEVV
ncbi:MAG: tRNA threonylcarbamoyladenosine biosynthesis protein TsaE [Chlamydiales bacterium]|nr:tRNA threonylcarbamoyladenosine biosynthesis protein TsaE [Chlamydiales bacterium]MCH9619744.1 tRNA threonylcarbamoyladenosine biosynthesis protein TsaE [Chlamydiales bacterium]MCH9623350.1 tRNA threonylcarbamoyladenosine biosynthesis protein TsaE [Chlamydiales bacterium]